MPAKRKPLECVTGGSIANASDSSSTLPFQNVKRRRGRPPKVAGCPQIPGTSLGLFELNTEVVSTSTSSMNRGYNLKANEVEFKSEFRKDVMRGLEQESQLGREPDTGSQREEGTTSLWEKQKEEMVNGKSKLNKDKEKGKRRGNDKEARKMEAEKGERKQKKSAKGNGKEKEKIENLPVPPAFDFLQSPFPMPKGMAHLPARSEKEDQSDLRPGDIF